jgi:NADH-quinone oxidoreductase subunit M
MQRVYLGAEYKGPHAEDLTPINTRETSIASVLLALAIVFGVFPAILINIMSPSVKSMAEAAQAGYQKSAGQVNELQAQR